MTTKLKERNETKNKTTQNELTSEKKNRNENKLGLRFTDFKTKKEVQRRQAKLQTIIATKKNICADLLKCKHVRSLNVCFCGAIYQISGWVAGLLT